MECHRPWYPAAQKPGGSTEPVVGPPDGAASRSLAKREDTSLAVFVSLAGVAVAAIGLLGLAAPGQLTDLLARWRILTGFPVTVALRVGFGTLFLVAAPHCRLPDVIRPIGVLEFAAAVLLLGLGSGRLQRFVAWWLERTPSFVRCWCSAALGFGILLATAGAGPGD